MRGRGSPTRSTRASTRRPRAMAPARPHRLGLRLEPIPSHRSSHSARDAPASGAAQGTPEHTACRPASQSTPTPSPGLAAGAGGGGSSDTHSRRPRTWNVPRRRTQLPSWSPRSRPRVVSPRAWCERRPPELTHSGRLRPPGSRPRSWRLGPRKCLGLALRTPPCSAVSIRIRKRRRLVHRAGHATDVVTITGRHRSARKPSSCAYSVHAGPSWGRTCSWALLSCPGIDGVWNLWMDVWDGIYGMGVGRGHTDGTVARSREGGSQPVNKTD